MINSSTLQEEGRGDLPKENKCVLYSVILTSEYLCQASIAFRDTEGGVLVVLAQFTVREWIV